jgi:hypothetical protein
MPATTAGANCAWICPVCKSLFMHRESFKGHIRRLRDPLSTSVHCLLDETNPEHQRLVSHPRYGTGTFDDRRRLFAEHFYATVRSHHSSRPCWPNSLLDVRFCCVDYVAPIASHHPIETCRRSMRGCPVEWRNSDISVFGMPYPRPTPSASLHRILNCYQPLPNRIYIAIAAGCVRLRERERARET